MESLYLFAHSFPWLGSDRACNNACRN